ncbi:MAG: methionyl-tRNA formyltransferase [Patescibacteria group bacterium]|nr:methionyl-tRNA formyltransferase [Patescibacteria group bacterium]
MSYKIIFFGTSEFSVPSLKALLDDDRFEVVAVITKPDAPIGRHQVVTPPPVKVLAQEHQVPVLQFDKIKTDETFEKLSASDNRVDAFVVVSYGKIIPQRILDLPKHGVINVHGSLLPLWRGASCVQAAIAAGDKKTGVTIMQMDAEMDHGNILTQKEVLISQTETGGELHDRLAELGAQTLPDVLSDYLAGKLKGQPQNHEQATYCKLLSRDDGKIDWTKSAEEIERLVRAYHPWPGTWTEWDGKRVKIIKIANGKYKELIGEIGILVMQDDRLLVVCGDGHAVEILELQPEGKRVMTSQEYIAGHKLIS